MLRMQVLPGTFEEPMVDCMTRDMSRKCGPSDGEICDDVWRLSTLTTSTLLRSLAGTLLRTHSIICSAVCPAPGTETLSTKPGQRPHGPLAWGNSPSHQVTCGAGQRRVV